MPTAAAIQKQLRHTWPLFFARHGQLTAVQKQAIPPILLGRNVVVSAATASGKTEAVMAPLLERYWDALRDPARPRLQILYICPTRALVRDLFERLQLPLESSAIPLAMKTGDTGPLNAGRPPSLLITTPESTDALLTRSPRLFADLVAIVLDEIHLLDNTPRGDQLRCLLVRLATIRDYDRPDSPSSQRIALSATIPDPDGVVRRYLHTGSVVKVPGHRAMAATVRPLYDADELVATLGERARQKTLIFCNSRAEVEHTAAHLRRHLPYHAEIFVHYSDLDSGVRREVEAGFAAASVAICVSTSTLELGIDIGTVDDVVLLGAPPDVTSFLQRTGRGGRRSAATSVVLLAKSPGEWARFEALQVLAMADDESWPDVREYAFRPAVLVQQIFSLIKQLPPGAIRHADVRRLAPDEVSDEQLQQIVAELTEHDYLRTGRLGEWKPAAELQLLFDRHDIYSNIGFSPLAAVAVDAHSGRTLGRLEQTFDVGDVIMLGGRPMEVIWRENYRIGLVATRRARADSTPRMHTAYAPIPFPVTQAVARTLRVNANQLVILPHDRGQLLFHFWGTLWGELLAAVLRAHDLRAAVVNEYCLATDQLTTQLPAWDEEVGQLAAMRTARALTDLLEMGRFHKLLPAAVAEAAAIKQLNLLRFQQIYEISTIAARTDINAQLYLLAS